MWNTLFLLHVPASLYLKGGLKLYSSYRIIFYNSECNIILIITNYILKAALLTLSCYNFIISFKYSILVK